MGLGANWHHEGALDRAPDAHDPLHDAAYSPPMPPIDLETPEPELRAHMVDLLRQEGELFEQGVTCPIKDMTDATCLACPMKRDHGTPEGKLCRVGQEQERVGTVALAKRHLGG